MNKEEIINIVKNIYEKLGSDYTEFVETRIEGINASYFMPNVMHYRGAAVIVGDDGSHLICGSIHPIDYYIEEYKNGKRDM